MGIWVANVDRSLGCGGVTMVANAIAMARTTIHAGPPELKMPAPGRRKYKSRQTASARGGWRLQRLADKDPAW